MQHGHRHEDLVDAMDHGYADGTLPPGTWLSRREATLPAVGTYSPEPGQLAFKPYCVPAQNVIAIWRFSGGPGREREAAEAWAFELTYYFLRGVGEQPIVEYAPGLLPGSGVYTVRGMMTTTHPGDHAETDFTPGDTPSLDFILDPARVKLLKDNYPTLGAYRFDGRDSEGD